MANPLVCLNRPGVGSKLPHDSLCFGLRVQAASQLRSSADSNFNSCAGWKVILIWRWDPSDIFWLYPEIELGAESILAELREMAQRRYISPYSIAIIHIGLNNIEEAFNWMEKLYRDCNDWLVWLRVGRNSTVTVRRQIRQFAKARGVRYLSSTSSFPTVDNLRCAKQSLVFLIGCKSQLSKVQRTTHTECCSRRGGEPIIERND